MKTLTSEIKYLFFLYIVLSFCTPFNLLHAEVPQPKYKIGAILPLSGDAASMGKAAQNGIIMAMDSLSEVDKNRIEVKFEDDGLVASKTVSAFRKLVEVDKVNSVICWSSGTCKAVAPIAESSKIPLIAIASDQTISQGRKYIVNFWVTPKEETKVLIPEAHRRGYKKIAIISTLHDGAQSIRDEFIEQNNSKIEILLNEEYPVEMKDFRSVATRIAALKELDAIMLVLLPGQLGTAAKQIRQLGSNAEFFGYELFEDRGEVEVSGGTLINGWFATGAINNELFTKKYEQRFPNQTIITSNNGYDSILLLAAATATDYSSENVAEFLRSVKDFSGASGTFSATGDNCFSLPATLKVVTKDGFEEF